MKINIADLLTLCYIAQHGTDEQKALLDGVVGEKDKGGGR